MHQRPDPAADWTATAAATASKPMLTVCLLMACTIKVTLSKKVKLTPLLLAESP